MKSRTSYFNNTVFKKNLTRFAPAWGLYTVCLMMGLFLMLDSGNTRWLPSNMAECIQIMCIITPCYALLVAQLLFGDLFNSRMCNALHALPMRRETWYMTNLLSGLVFHLIPTAIMAVAATVIMALGSFNGGWVMGPIWFVGVNLQYLCFFGIGVFSVFCVGNRFAQAVVYGILNLVSLIAAWLVDTLYVPMFYGIQLQTEPFLWFCPVGQMMENPFIYVERIYQEVWSDAIPGQIMLGENFWYYFICAAVGIVLMAAALQMYRKRRLECAGDFMAIKVLEPVFHVVYSLMVGAVFAFVIDDIFGFSDGILFLFIGLAVGYFTGRMLLMRNVQVFQKKGWLGCGALMAAFGLTLVLAAIDPFGIETWVPVVGDVKSVTVADGHYNYHDSEVTLEDPADIENVIAMHTYALEEHLEYLIAAPVAEVTEDVEVWDNTTAASGSMKFSMPLTFSYQLTDGRTVNRYYYVYMDNAHGANVKEWFSSFACVFEGETDIDQMLDAYKRWYIVDAYSGTEHFFNQEEVMASLLEAIRLDCEAGVMVQDGGFRQGTEDEVIYWLYLENDENIIENRIYSSCENTLNWLRNHGYEVDEILELQRG